MSFYYSLFTFGGFRIQIPLEVVVFFRANEKLVGLALGRLVNCEVNVLRNSVTLGILNVLSGRSAWLNIYTTTTQGR